MRQMSNDLLGAREPESGTMKRVVQHHLLKEYWPQWRQRGECPLWWAKRVVKGEATRVMVNLAGDFLMPVTPDRACHVLRLGGESVGKENRTHLRICR